MTFKERILAEYNQGGSLSHYQLRQWNTQSKPYRFTLGFVYEDISITGSRGYSDRPDTYYPIGIIQLPDLSWDAMDQAINRAYEKLVNQLGTPSQMANNILEVHQSLGALTGRATQLAKFASNLRKGNFFGAFKALGSPNTVRQGFKPKSKDFGGQFLEYHFGWQPLVQDIGNAMDTLTKPNFDVRKASGHGHANNSPSTYVHGSENNTDFFRSTSWSNSFSCKMGCRFTISNPNAFLASQLGLVNPASIAWEAVPFSFVADWFSNVGQVLSSMTDFVGLSIEDAYTTTSTEIKQNFNEAYWNGPGGFFANGHYSGKLFKVERFSGLKKPILSLKPFHGFSLTRGVTAISLLLQQLR